MSNGRGCICQRPEVAMLLQWFLGCLSKISAPVLQHTRLVDELDCEDLKITDSHFFALYLVGD